MTVETSTLPPTPPQHPSQKNRGTDIKLDYIQVFIFQITPIKTNYSDATAKN